MSPRWPAAARPARRPPPTASAARPGCRSRRRPARPSPTSPPGTPRPARTPPPSRAIDLRQRGVALDRPAGRLGRAAENQPEQAEARPTTEQSAPGAAARPGRTGRPAPARRGPGPSRGGSMPGAEVAPHRQRVRHRGQQRGQRHRQRQHPPPLARVGADARGPAQRREPTRPLVARRCPRPAGARTPPRAPATAIPRAPPAVSVSWAASPPTVAKTTPTSATDEPVRQRAGRRQPGGDQPGGGEQAEQQVGRVRHQQRGGQPGVPAEHGRRRAVPARPASSSVRVCRMTVSRLASATISSRKPPRWAVSAPTLSP